MAKFGNYDWRNLQGDEYAKDREILKKEEKGRYDWSQLSFKEKLSKCTDIDKDLNLTFSAGHFFSQMCSSFSFCGLNIETLRNIENISDKIHEDIHKYSNKRISYYSNNLNDSKVYTLQKVFIEIKDTSSDPLESDENLKEMCKSISKKISLLCYTVSYYHENNKEQYIYYYKLYWENVHQDLINEYNQIVNYLN